MTKKAKKESSKSPEFSKDWIYYQCCNWTFAKSAGLSSLPRLLFLSLKTIALKVKKTKRSHWNM